MFRSISLVIAIVAGLGPTTCVAHGAGVLHLPIGYVFANGEFWMDDYEIRSNVSIFDGSLVDTVASPSHVNLSGGVRIDLAAKSRAQIYRDHLVLETGSVQVRGRYTVAAIRFCVRGTASSDFYRIGISNGSKLQVSVLSGKALVNDSHGNLIASIAADRTLEFCVLKSGSAAPFGLTGCIQRAGTHFVLRDDITDVIAELISPTIVRNVGSRYRVVGTLDTTATPINGASQVIDVIGITPASGKACAVEISGAASTVILASGASSHTTAAIIAGIAVTLVRTKIADAFHGGHAEELGATKF